MSSPHSVVVYFVVESTGWWHLADVITTHLNAYPPSVVAPCIDVLIAVLPFFTIKVPKDSQIAWDQDKIPFLIAVYPTTTAIWSKVRWSKSDLCRFWCRVDAEKKKLRFSCSPWANWWGKHRTKKGKIQLKEYLQLDKKNLSKVIQNGLANVLCHIKCIHFKYMTNKCSSKT